MGRTSGVPNTDLLDVGCEPKIPVELEDVEAVELPKTDDEVTVLDPNTDWVELEVASVPTTDLLDDGCDVEVVVTEDAAGG